MDVNSLNRANRILYNKFLALLNSLYTGPSNKQKCYHIFATIDQSEYKLTFLLVFDGTGICANICYVFILTLFTSLSFIYYIISIVISE